MSLFEISEKEKVERLFSRVYKVSQTLLEVWLSHHGVFWLEDLNLTSARHVSPRIIAATHCCMEQKCQKNNFRKAPGYCKLNKLPFFFCQSEGRIHELSKKHLQHVLHGCMKTAVHGRHEIRANYICISCVFITITIIVRGTGVYSTTLADVTQTQFTAAALLRRQLSLSL